jgi:ribosomal protein S18 acetylase RimI-like enzyme
LAFNDTQKIQVRVPSMSASTQSSPSDPHVLLRYDVKAGDAETVRRMIQAAGVFRRAEIEVAVELVQDRLGKGQLSEYQFILAERNGRMIGYACYGHIACTVGSYDLYWIAVDPPEQRNGVGRLLLAQVEKAVSRQFGRRIYVETSSRAEYHPARRLYEGRGYRRVATLPDFYAPADAKIIYVKELLTSPRST